MLIAFLDVNFNILQENVEQMKASTKLWMLDAM